MTEQFLYETLIKNHSPFIKTVIPNTIAKLLAIRNPADGYYVCNRGLKLMKGKSFAVINELLKKHKEKLFREYKIKAIGIFGSFVRSEQRRRSDIDILVEFEKLPDLLKFIEIECRLEKILRRKVDLVEKTGLKPALKDIILQEVVYI